MVLLVALLVVGLAAHAAVGDPGNWVLYVDPSARFSVRYPRGWQVREDFLSGRTAFYRNNPDEGVAFLVFPRTEAPGDVDAGALTRWALASVAELHRFPSLQYRHRTEERSGVVHVRGEATWTTGRGRPMRALFTLLAGRPPVHGFPAQLFYMLLAQAPEREWRQWEVTLVEMLRDFKWIGG